MNDTHEAVALPDPAVKKYLHPTDLPDARGLYLRGWWFGRLGSLPIACAIGALIWLLSGSLAAALVAPLSTFVIGLLAGTWYESRAWDFIPRRRQDRTAARSWRGLATVMDACALLVIAAALVLSLDSRPIAEEVVVFAVGSGLGVAGIQLIELIAALTHSQTSAPISSRIIMLLAVIVAALILGGFGVTGGWGPRYLGVAAMGAATILAAQGIWWVFSTVRGRRDVDAEP